MNFLDFAAAHGLRIHSLIADGRWHRCPTEDKPRKRNGAYLWDGDRGVVKNFATMQDYAAYREGARVGPVDKAALRARRAIAEAETRAKQVEARQKAVDMLKRAAIGPHPYLAAKGFPDEVGFVLDGELLIPMRDFNAYRNVLSVQRIAESGSKLFLPGGKTKGAVFLLGTNVRERWLCEGFATALSLRAALRYLHRDASIVVCFSASNLTFIGRQIKRGFVMADNDDSMAGEMAARESGLPFVMPPVVGMDANDYQKAEGLARLAKLIRQATEETVRARA